MFVAPEKCLYGNLDPLLESFGSPMGDPPCAVEVFKICTKSIEFSIGPKIYEKSESIR